MPSLQRDGEGLQVRQGQSPTTALTFADLADGDRFQIEETHLRKHKLPRLTYRKVDEMCADHSGGRGLFRPNTPVVRSAESV